MTPRLKQRIQWMLSVMERQRMASQPQSASLTIEQIRQPIIQLSVMQSPNIWGNYTQQEISQPRRGSISALAGFLPPLGLSGSG